MGLFHPSETHLFQAIYGGGVIYNLIYNLVKGPVPCRVNISLHEAPGELKQKKETEI